MSDASDNTNLPSPLVETSPVEASSKPDGGGDRLAAALRWCKIRKKAGFALSEKEFNERMTGEKRYDYRDACGEGFVYLAVCQGLIKIGVAGDVHTRIRDLQVGNPFEILLLGIIPSLNPYQEEFDLHTKYLDHNVRGEWFDIPEPDRSELIHMAFERFTKYENNHVSKSFNEGTKQVGPGAGSSAAGDGQIRFGWGA